MPRSKPKAPRSGPQASQASPTRAPSTSRSESGLFRRPWVAPLALVLLTALVYARSLGVPIHDWDDHVYFFRDARVEHPSAENVGRILVEPFFSNYHPVTTLTIAFDRAVWRTWVPGFHLTHLFFYAGGVLGIYLLFARILRRRAEAFVGAAIYAVHAVHVESVAWLASRKDVVCLFFYVFALVAYARYAGGGPGRWRASAASIALAAAAMLSKGYAVILPAVFYAYDLCFAPRVTRRHALDKIPFVVLAGLTTILTVRAQDKQSALIDMALSVGDRVVRLGEVLALYVAHTILPIRLSAIYSTGMHPPSPFLGLLGILVAIAIPIGFLAWRRSRPAAAFGIALYVLPLATVMNVYYTLRIWMTDRYLLFPTIGSSLLLVALAASWARGTAPAKEAGRASRRRAVAWAAALLVVLYSALTVGRIGVWTSGVNLWSDVLRRQLDLAGSGPVTAAALSPAAVRRLPDPGPLVSLRRAYETRGDPAEAARLEGLADSIGAEGYEHTEMRLARLDIAAGRHEDALRRLRPVAEGRTWFAPLARFRIGVVEERLGRADASRESYRRALEMYREANQPATDAYFEVGTWEYLAGNYGKAIEWYRQAQRESPREADTAFHLGLALQQSGRVPEAMEIYRRIASGELFFKPHSRVTVADVYLQMATALEVLGRKEEAIRNFEEVLRRNPNYPQRDAIRAKITALGGGAAG